MVRLPLNFFATLEFLKKRLRLLVSAAADILFRWGQDFMQGKSIGHFSEFFCVDNHRLSLAVNGQNNRPLGFMNLFKNRVGVSF
jgi:hypothetical protein